MSTILSLRPEDETAVVQVWNQIIEEADLSEEQPWDSLFFDAFDWPSPESHAMLNTRSLAHAVAAIAYARSSGHAACAALAFCSFVSSTALSSPVESRPQLRARGAVELLELIVVSARGALSQLSPQGIESGAVEIAQRGLRGDRSGAAELVETLFDLESMPPTALHSVLAHLARAGRIDG